METSSNTRRFLGGLFCGVLGILLFESHGTAAAVTGGVGGFVLGAFLPSLVTFWRYMRSVPEASMGHVQVMEEVHYRVSLVGLLCASLLLVVWVVLPCVACGSLELVTSGHAGVVSPLWRQVTRYSEIALAVFVIINTLAMFVAMITYGDRYFMEDTDLRVKRLTELPLSTVWRRQSRHMIGWVFAMNIYIMVTVGVVALLSLTTGFQSGYYGMVLRRAMLAVRSQTAKYTVSATASVVTMLACAFIAEPYLDSRLLPWIAFGSGLLCGGMALLAPLALSKESYREAVKRLRPALKNARAKHYADERGLEALLAERVLRLQESRIGRAMRPLPSLWTCTHFNETISF